MPEALVPFDHVSAKDDAQLQAVLAAYENSNSPEHVEPLIDFLSHHPHSPWRQSLWLNLGSIDYHHGYFSDALHAWRQAWDSAKSFTANRCARSMCRTT